MHVCMVICIKAKKSMSIRLKVKGEEEKTCFGRVSSLSTRETIIVNEIVEKASYS